MAAPNASSKPSGSSNLELTFVGLRVLLSIICAVVAVIYFVLGNKTTAIIWVTASLVILIGPIFLTM